MTEVETYDLARMLLLLDASQDALDAAAKAEERREHGKSLRCITAQKRAKTVRDFVPEMALKYGVEI